MTKIGIIEYCNNKEINLDEYVDGIKEYKNLWANCLKEINNLQKERRQLKDKLHHRNMQIKDLQQRLREKECPIFNTCCERKAINNV